MGSKKSKQPMNRIPPQCCGLIVCDCPPPHAKIYNCNYDSVPSDCSDTEQNRRRYCCQEQQQQQQQQLQQQFCRERERERERHCRERERERRQCYESRHHSRSSQHSCSEDEQPNYLAHNYQHRQSQEQPEHHHYHHHHSQQDRHPRYRTYYAEYNDLMNEAKRKLDSVTYHRLPRHERRLSCSSISSIDSF